MRQKCNMLWMAFSHMFCIPERTYKEKTLLSLILADILLLILRPDSQDFQGTAVN